MVESGKKISRSGMCSSMSRSLLLVLAAFLLSLLELSGCGDVHVSCDQDLPSYFFLRTYLNSPAVVSRF